MCSLYRALYFLIGRSTPVRSSSEFLLQFLKVIISAIVCLSPVIDCEAFLRLRIILNAGGVSGGALGRRLSFKQGGRKILYVDIVSNTFLNACTYCLTKTMKSAYLRLFCFQPSRVKRLLRHSGGMVTLKYFQRKGV